MQARHCAAREGIKTMSKDQKLGTEKAQESAKEEELATEALDAVTGGAKELQGQNRMGNFEIQDLMSSYNQAETLTSSIARK
jgi:hypothetical protein